MKKFFYVAIMTFVMIGMSACSKDKDLTGTKWVGQISVTEESLTITANVTAEFTTETAGKMSVEPVITDELRQMFAALGMTDEEIAEMLGMSESINFTYTYDGKGAGTMTAKDEDGQESTINFTIDDDKLTAKDDEGHTIVLTKQK